MNLDTYQELSARTEKPLPMDEALVHGSLGLLTEAGEFTTEVKRHVIYGKPITPDVRLHLIEEAGDFAWYLALMARATNNRLSAVDSLVKLEGINTSGAQLQTVCAVMSMSAFGAWTVAHPMDQHSLLMGVSQCLMGGISALLLASALLEHPLEDMLAENIAKLAVRFPEKYTDHHAEARLDKGGLSHLHS